MLRKTICLIAACACLFCLTACAAHGGEEETKTLPDEFSYSFTDDCGNSVTLNKRPEKTAVLFSSFADMWVSSGGTVSITVGESVERAFAPDSAVLVDKGAGKTINTELLVASKPDFVICSADIPAQVKAAELMRKSGVPAACFHVETFDEYLRVLKICTDITGRPDMYTENGINVKNDIDSSLSALTKTQKNLKILFIRAGSGLSSTKAKTADNNFVCGMLKELGTKNIAEDAPVLLDGLSIEAVLRENPDWILISTMGNEEASKAYMDSVLSAPEWQALSAVKGNHVAYLPKEYFQYKPNARWGEAYEWLINLFYGN